MHNAVGLALQRHLEQQDTQSLAFIALVKLYLTKRSGSTVSSDLEEVILTYLPSHRAPAFPLDYLSSSPGSI
jgi:hypothetical protein